MSDKMKYITTWYANKYQSNAVALFGWTRDDLMQNIRVVMWKGLATFDASKKFKVETYLSKILEHYFANLAKRCRVAQKYRSPNSFDMSFDDEEKFSSHDHVYRNQFTSEIKAPDAVLQDSRSVQRFLGRLTDFEFKVLELSIYGEDGEAGRPRATYNTAQIAKKLNVPRNQVSQALKSLRIELKHHLRMDEDDGDNI